MTEKPIAHHFGYKYRSPFGHDADVLRYDAGPWNGQHPHAVVAFYTEAQLDAYTAELRAEVERLREREAGLLEQHSRDSAELRRVCAERDEARADERTAMSYLAAVRQVVGGEDFPDMVRRVEGLRADAERLDRLDAQRGDNVQRNQYGEPELVAHYWAVEGQCHDVRTAIDNTMEASNAG